MSLYSVFVHDQKYSVDLSGDQNKVNGQPMPVNLTRLNNDGVYLMRKGRKVMEVCVFSQDPRTYEVSVNGRRMLAHIETKNRTARNHAADSSRITAPMPGIIISVLARSGDTVEKGQVLAVLESMKMQMQIRSPYRGVVSQVAAQAKQRVEKGAFLVQLREEIVL